MKSNFFDWIIYLLVVYCVLSTITHIFVLSPPSKIDISSLLQSKKNRVSDCFKEMRKAARDPKHEDGRKLSLSWSKDSRIAIFRSSLDTMRDGLSNIMTRVRNMSNSEFTGNYIGLIGDEENYWSVLGNADVVFGGKMVYIKDLDNLKNIDISA